MKKYKVLNQILIISCFVFHFCGIKRVSNMQQNKNSFQSKDEKYAETDLAQSYKKIYSMPQGFYCKAERIFKSLNFPQIENGIGVMGLTGAGKSTFVNYMRECLLERGEEGSIKVKKKKGISSLFKKIYNKKEQISKIGHSLSSETLYPRAYYCKDTKIHYVDYPGLGDNRSKEIALQNLLISNYTLHKIKNLKSIIIALEYDALTSARGKKARDGLLDILKNLCYNTQENNVLENTHLLVTKVDKLRSKIKTDKKVKDANKKIKEIVIRKIEKFCVKEEDKKIIEKFLNKDNREKSPTNSNIIIFDPLNPKNIEKIRNQIITKTNINKQTLNLVGDYEIVNIFLKNMEKEIILFYKNLEERKIAKKIIADSKNEIHKLNIKKLDLKKNIESILSYNEISIEQPFSLKDFDKNIRSALNRNIGKISKYLRLIRKDENYLTSLFLYPDITRLPLECEDNKQSFESFCMKKIGYDNLNQMFEKGSIKQFQRIRSDKKFSDNIKDCTCFSQIKRKAVFKFYDNGSIPSRISHLELEIPIDVVCNCIYCGKFEEQTVDLRFKKGTFGGQFWINDSTVKMTIKRIDDWYKQLQIYKKVIVFQGKYLTLDNVYKKTLELKIQELTQKKERLNQIIKKRDYFEKNIVKQQKLINQIDIFLKENKKKYLSIIELSEKINLNQIKELENFKAMFEEIYLSKKDNKVGNIIEG